MADRKDYQFLFLYVKNEKENKMYTLTRIITREFNTGEKEIVFSSDDYREVNKHFLEKIKNSRDYFWKTGLWGKPACDKDVYTLRLPACSISERIHDGCIIGLCAGEKNRIELTIETIDEGKQ